MIQSLARLQACRCWFANHQRAARAEDGHDASCLLCALAEDIATLNTLPSNEPFAPACVQQRAQWDAAQTFANTDQHDASEAFGALLNACNDVDMKAAAGLGLGPIGAYTPTAHTTPYWKIFGSLTRQTTRCAPCARSTTKYEACTGFSLALPDGGRHRIEEIFAGSLGLEPLHDDCVCGAPRGSRTKHTEILPERTPQVLVLHLKRWAWNEGQQRFVKNPVSVSYETLFPLLPGETYDLRSVIVHEGVAGGGHYTSFVRAGDNFWYHVDDSATPERQRSVAAVLGHEAYMLIYEKR